MSTVLVIINAATSPPRRMAGWLADAGLDVVTVHAPDGVPDSLSGVDGLVMLGGGFMPDEFDRAPWLRAERKLAARAVDADLPTFGICLGGQLLADIAGGEVRKSFGPVERGAVEILPTTAGTGDPVLATLGAGAPMIENHEDMITRLPADAVLLASSDAVANQAFRLGEHVRGVQFHPEVAAEDLREWEDAALAGEGYSLDELIDGARRVDADNTVAARRMTDAFAAEVLGR